MVPTKRSLWHCSAAAIGIAGTERLADPLGEEIVLATSDEAESVETIRSVGDLNLDGFDDFAIEPVAGSGASPTLVFGGPRDRYVAADE